MSRKTHIDIPRLLEEMERLREENTFLKARLALEGPEAEGDKASPGIPGGSRCWEQLLDSTFDLLFIKDSQARYQWVNKAFCSFFKQDRGSFAGGVVEDFFSAKQAGLFREEDSRALAGEEVVSRHVYEVDGGECVLRIQRQPFRDKDGRVVGIIGMARDETGLRDMQRALAEVERSYDTLFQNALEGVFRSTLEGRFLAVNPALAAMLGYASPEELMEGVTDIQGQLYMESSDRGRYLDLLRKQKGAPGFKTRFRRKDGQAIWVLLNTHMVQDAEGREKYLEGTVMDVTAMHRAEEELRQAVTSAEAANQTKSRFLANMSHELRTPLNGAMGMLQLLKTSRLSREQSSYVGNALSCCTNLTRLLGDILDLSKVEAGVMELEEAPFDPREALDDIVATFGDSVAQGRVFLCMEVDGSVPRHVSGDMVRFRQVLFNLVGNAMKYTRQGRVTVSLSMLAGEGERQRMLCTVSDTGVGIPEGKLEKMFEPFTQGDNSYTRRAQGVGLGLHIVKRLVSIMKGNMAMDTEEGKGVTVYLSLPFGRVDDDSPGEEKKAPDTSDRSGLPVGRVLVAEDDRVNQLAVLRFLEKLGIAARCVADGQSAIQALAEDEYDCVLMDIQMPILDGVEATRRIRSGKAVPGKERIPIIALTACVMAGDKDRLLGAGMDGYLSKPVEFGSLATALNSLTRGAPESGDRE